MQYKNQTASWSDAVNVTLENISTIENRIVNYTGSFIY
jgi:hypothetical protein